MNGDVALLGLIRDSAIIGPLIGGTGVGVARVFLSDAPQKTVLPFVVCDVYDGQPFDTKDGASVTDHDLVKVFVYAELSKDAVAIATTIRTAADEARGTYNSKTVVNIRWMNEDGYNIDLENRKVYVRETDYQVRIRV